MSLRHHVSILGYRKLAVCVFAVGFVLSGCATTGRTASDLAILALTGVDVGKMAQQNNANGLSPSDPNVKCKPTYTQVYQPPLKLGGAGRVIQVPSGQKCEQIETGDAKAAVMREARFTSLPSGAFVAIHKHDKALSPLGGCQTPCSITLDTRQRYIGIAQMMGETKAKGEFIPIAFPPKDEKGVGIYFTRTEPITVKLSALSAPAFSKADGTAISGEDAMPLVRVPAIMPMGATKSGHCNVQFDVSPEGVPTNIEAAPCTDKIFRAPSLSSVTRWVYNPKLVNGQAVGMIGVESKVSFRLVNMDGKVLTE